MLTCVCLPSAVFIGGMLVGELYHQFILQLVNYYQVYNNTSAVDFDPLTVDMTCTNTAAASVDMRIIYSDN